MDSVEEIMKKLREHARPDHVAGMARYGMAAERRLGVSVPDMRRIAKNAGKNHRLALELWKTGVPEAQIVASMIAEPEKLTEEEMENWVKDINSWDVCDQVCMNLFEKTPFAWKKIREWSERKEEFVKRAAFALMACLAWHDKETRDEQFIDLIPLIQKGAVDERNFVKKAVSWALRNIGKRNVNLNTAALHAARKLQRMDSRAARWIASTAIRELQNEAVQQRLKR